MAYIVPMHVKPKFTYLQPDGQICQILIALCSFNGCISSQIQLKTIVNFKLPDWKSGCPRLFLVVQRNKAFGFIGPGGTIYIYIYIWPFIVLTHWGRVTRIYISKLTIIEIHTLSFTKICWKMSSEKWRPLIVSASTLFSSIYLWFIFYFVFVELAFCAYRTQRHSSSCLVVTSGTS